MKPSLRLAFSDFWNGFDPEENLFYHLLKSHFEIINDQNNPEILIYSCFGFKYLNFNCHRIFFAGENVRPDHRECDYSLTFDYETYGGKNLRLPLYLFTYLKFLEKGNEHPLYHNPKTKFCNFVVSNPNCKARNDFFDQLSKIKKVDSGGRFKNNLSKPIANKLEFISHYKFTMAFENSSYPGYVTEKLIEPMLIGSIPIYWGSKRVREEFNEKAFINVNNFRNYKDAIDYILEVDRNKELYNSIIEEPFLINNAPREAQNYEAISLKMKQIVASLLNEPQKSSNRFVYSWLKKSKKKLVNKITRRPIWDS